MVPPLPMGWIPRAWRWIRRNLPWASLLVLIGCQGLLDEYEIDPDWHLDSAADLQDSETVELDSDTRGTLDSESSELDTSSPGGRDSETVELDSETTAAAVYVCDGVWDDTCDDKACATCDLDTTDPWCVAWLQCWYEICPPGDPWNGELVGFCK